MFMDSQSLTEYLATAQEAARRGAEVLARWRQRFQVREKGRFDLVTEADLESQQAIRDFLVGRFPNHGFLGEEGKPSQAPLCISPQSRGEIQRAEPPTWIVDPLDGTTNYVHDCPFYCVSVGLQVAGELVVGVVFDPCRQEMFHAAQGKGCWLGDRRLRTSQTTRPEEALLATGFPPDLRGQERTLDWWRYFSLRTQSLRRTGSTALNLAYVAAGRFDGYWAFDNHVWDVAAGTVLIREAGGMISNIDGSPYDPYTPDALANNGPLHPVLLQAMQDGP
jgi:myo-inositol-1(or 4)-monophosphatase